LELLGYAHFDMINARIVAITLDTEGALIMEKGKKIFHCQAPAVTAPQVSGAGDTWLSAFLLAYLCSGDSEVSGDIATAAAAIAIKKESTAICHCSELKARFYACTKCILSLPPLLELCSEYHQQGKRIVFTNGCFDILHSGHVNFLLRAKQLGDVLIVGVNNDESIKRLKGEQRPVNPLSDRLQVLAGLSSVDHIVPFGKVNDDTPIPLISIVQPHFFVKGGDYNRDQLPEAPVVEKLGGSIVFVPLVPDHSTTETIKRITHINANSSPTAVHL
jgi:D-beta-D-heptose 7-phosphate kinase/D-beta-D-heptose 1-phosphate adenosyltransferase